ncbi:MAG: LPS assembly lipoprotein LptE [Planctomycetota bacterium]|jgi:hypothetical protein
MPGESALRRLTRGLPRIAVAGLATAVLAAAVAGCSSDPRTGWSTTPVHDASIGTIAVPIARNGTWDRSVHLELTEAIVKEIEARTPWRVVPESRARTILDVTIREVELEQLSRSRGTGLAEEMALTLRVDFDWTRIDTGDTLAARRDFAASALFVPSPPAGERIEVGRFDAVARTAAAIVDALEGSW